MKDAARRGGESLTNDVVLQVAGVDFHYAGGAPLLVGLSLDVRRGEFLGVVGPNGAGKSTLLHLLSGVLRPRRGETRLMGRPLAHWPRREAARRVAVVPQSEETAFPFRVSEVVLMGRTPHLHGLLATETDADIEAARKALDLLGLADLACRPLNQLSGGERQLVLVARALAQEAEVILLDEPTASLDLAHQQQLFRLLAELNEKRGLTVIVVTHDLNLAALYCRRLAVLHDGRIAAEGPPADIMNGEFLGRVYRAGLWTGLSPAGAPMVGLVK